MGILCMDNELEMNFLGMIMFDLTRACNVSSPLETAQSAFLWFCVCRSVARFGALNQHLCEGELQTFHQNTWILDNTAAQDAACTFYPCFV